MFSLTTSIFFGCETLRGISAGKLSKPSTQSQGNSESVLATNTIMPLNTKFLTLDLDRFITIIRGE
jgi:hypothetical protein